MVRIAGSHPAGPGSIPGNGILFSFLFSQQLLTGSHWISESKLDKIVFWSSARVAVDGGNCKKILDEDGIRTHAGRAHWISSPTP